MIIFRKKKIENGFIKNCLVLYFTTTQKAKPNYNIILNEALKNL